MKSIIWILGAAGVIAGCGSSSKPPAFRSFEEVSSQGELGQCCTTCRGSLRVDSDGALTSSSTGAVTCHADLSATERNGFGMLVTSPDVVQALSNPAACGGEAAIDEGDEMRLDLSDGSSIDNPAAGGCNTGPLDDVRRALWGFDQEYCATTTCAGAPDAAAN